MVSGSWDRVLRRALCSAGGLLPPLCLLSACVSAYLSVKWINKIFKNIYILLIYLREREKVQAGVGTSRFWAEHRAWLRTLSYDPEIMTWATIKSGTLNRQNNTGAPKLLFTFINWLFSLSYPVVSPIVICASWAYVPGKQHGCIHVLALDSDFEEVGNYGAPVVKTFLFCLGGMISPP